MAETATDSSVNVLNEMAAFPNIDAIFNRIALSKADMIQIDTAVSAFPRIRLFTDLIIRVLIRFKYLLTQ